MLNKKLLADAQQAVLDNIQEHNNAHNPSGVPLNGEANRPAPQTYDGNDAKDANTYASEADGPKPKVSFQRNATLPSRATIMSS